MERALSVWAAGSHARLQWDGHESLGPHEWQELGVLESTQCGPSRLLWEPTRRSPLHRGDTEAQGLRGLQCEEEWGVACVWPQGTGFSEADLGA